MSIAAHFAVDLQLPQIWLCRHFERERSNSAVFRAVRQANDVVTVTIRCLEAHDYSPMELVCHASPPHFRADVNWPWLGS